jgi:DNA-binding CsgD family transcriptional regulator
MMTHSEPVGRLSVRGSSQTASARARSVPLALAPTDTDRAVDVVRGREPVTRRLTKLVARAAQEILVINGATHAGQFPRSVVRAALERGVRVRSVYASGLLAAEDEATPPIQVIAGEQARALPAVPVTFLLVDLSVAATPLVVDASGRITSLLVINPSALLETGVALAEHLWRQAASVTHAGGGAPPPSAEDAVLLELLQQGLKDRAIARALGIGERTVQRRLSALMSQLGAKTRFQAALNAVRRGWL